ncbi:MAG: thioredoxin [Planctomycetes bacterium]|nr:thioredoxin [Planctomycetota bacterium]
MATLEITDDNFQAEVVDSGAPVLLDFYATWCGPCKAIAPMMETLAEEYADRGLKVGKVDIDVARATAIKFGITGVPTLMFFKDGERVDQIIGAAAKPAVESKLKGIL